MNKKISIVIPVFNDEMNISVCLKSCLNQDMDLSDYEIIVVNDGSSDGTQSIVENFQKKYKNLILINTENKKLGAARNTGVKNSNGKYIIFIDSDDFIRGNVLNKIFREVDEGNLDILMADFYDLNDKGELKKNLSYARNNSKIQTGIDFIKSNEVFWYAWHSVYKKNFLLENKIKYREGVFFEDVDVSLKSVYLAKNIKYEPLFFYVHKFNENSIVNGKLTNKKLSDQVASATCLYDFVKTTRVVDNDVYLILMRHVILKYIRPLKTSFYLGFKEKLHVCKSMKKSKIKADVKFKINPIFFIIASIVYLSPVFSAVLISAIAPLIKFIKNIKPKLMLF